MEGNSIAQIYTYKEHEYLFLSTCMMKNESTREWVEGVIYRSMNSTKVWVRNKAEFYRKFKLKE